MNFLAHIYLSGEDKNIMLGNFIGDYVKGKKYENYADPIQKGILLHRKIDYFTDKHPVVKKSSQLLKPKFNRYSGVVIDLFYDHFLASNWANYSSQPLNKFAANFHQLLIRNYFKLPGEVKSFLPFLIKNKRLENYQYIDGIEKSLSIMTKYTSIPSHVHFAIQQLSVHYNEFQDDFNLFFNDVQEMVSEELKLI